MHWLRKPWFSAVVAMVVGGGIMALVLRQQDLGALWAEMRQAQLGWLLLAVVLAGVGHWVRAMRWRLLLRQSGSEVPTAQAFSALMIAYIVNFVVPRLGEVTRCALLYRHGRVPIARAAGTVVGERAVDVLSLGICVLICVAVSGGALQDFWTTVILPPLEETLAKRGLLALRLVTFLGIIVAVGAVALAYYRGRVANFVRRTVRQGWEGLSALRAFVRDGRLTVQTVLIWLSYWSGPVCTLWAMDMARADWVEVSFTMFVTGSIARTIPLPAGSMGPYHWLVSQVLIVYGYGPTEALAAATVNHATQTLFYFIGGALGLGIQALGWGRGVEEQ
jgi:glycosyltransferase 2 family protein